MSAVLNVVSDRDVAWRALSDALRPRRQECKRVIVMDHIFRARPGEKYLSRYNWFQLKGKPPEYMETPVGPVYAEVGGEETIVVDQGNVRSAYKSLDVLKRVYRDRGYRLTLKQQSQLRQRGETFHSEGGYRDVRYVLPIDADLMPLVNACGMVNDWNPDARSNERTSTEIGDTLVFWEWDTSAGSDGAGGLHVYGATCHPAAFAAQRHMPIHRLAMK